MSTQAKLVMWLGLFLIAMNVVVNWQTIRGAIFGGKSSSTGSKPPTGGGLCDHCASLPLPLRISCEALCISKGVGLVTKPTPAKSKGKVKQVS
jgi:hypothetical protein